MSDLEKDLLSRSLRRNLFAGIAGILIIFGGAGGWAATTEVASAVVSSAEIIVEGSAKKVQHFAGGTISELLVTEGQRVTSGEVLARLDDTVAKANLAALSHANNQLYARRARLSAERNDRTSVATPKELMVRLSGGAVETAMEAERRLFRERIEARSGEKARIREQITQLEQQITGLEEQKLAKTDEIELIRDELDVARRLLTKGLALTTRVNNLDRNIARLRGERGQLVASIASTKAKISETRLQLFQVDEQMRAEVAAELRDVENRQAELLEQETKAISELTRLDIRAPISGDVHKLAVHTVGGVVGPGEVLMEIVPKDGELVVEAHIAPNEVDQIAVGMPATLRLTPFNRNTTPELNGTVVRISADIETDEKTRLNFYKAAIAINPGQEEGLGGLTLLPGMPVEAFINRGNRSVASYFFKPIRDHAQRVFREE